MSVWVRDAAVWLVIAYLIGAVPVGVLLARARGIDLRHVGSGNIGATNAARALGTRWGLIVFGLDVVKAAVPVWLAGSGVIVAPLPLASLVWVAAAAVVGHIFPVYLGFRGGKGVACALGVFVAIDPSVALGAIAMYAQGLWLTRVSAVGSLTAVTSLTLTVVLAGRPIPEQALAVAMATLIWWRHRGNVRAILEEGRERKRRAASDGTRTSEASR